MSSIYERAKKYEIRVSVYGSSKIEFWGSNVEKVLMVSAVRTLVV